MSLFNKMKVTKQRKTRVAKSGLSIAYNESFVLALEEAASLQNTYIVMELRETSSNKLGREGEKSVIRLRLGVLHTILFLVETIYSPYQPQSWPRCWWAPAPTPRGRGRCSGRRRWPTRGWRSCRCRSRYFCVDM